MKGRFGDLITAMATPFDESGALDLPAAERLADFLVTNGSDGLVIAGSTGESPTLSDSEKIELLRTVAGAVGGRAKIIAGTGSYSTSHTIEMTELAQKAGAEAALVVTPYYNRPPQNALLEHFKAVARSTELPIILYDIPIRTARKIEHETLIELAGVSNIVAIKDACGDAQGAARLVRDAPEGFQVYSGNDGDTLPWLSVGAVGVIAVASHIVGPQMAEMISLFHGGDAEGARKIHLDLMPVFDAMGLTTNPIPLKAALEMIGQSAGRPRLPLVEATDQEKARIREVIGRTGVI